MPSMESIQELTWLCCTRKVDDASNLKESHNTRLDRSEKLCFSIPGPARVKNCTLQSIPGGFGPSQQRNWPGPMIRIGLARVIHDQ